MRKRQDPFVRYAVVQSLRQGITADRLWLNLERELPPIEALSREEKPFLEGLCRVLADEYEWGGLLVLDVLLKHPQPSVRQLAAETLARVYIDRKPYAGGWWGTQPASQKPPARVVAWEGTPQGA